MGLSPPECPAGWILLTKTVKRTKIQKKQQQAGVRNWNKSPVLAPRGPASLGSRVSYELRAFLSGLFLQLLLCIHLHGTKMISVFVFWFGCEAWNPFSHSHHGDVECEWLRNKNGKTGFVPFISKTATRGSQEVKKEKQKESPVRSKRRRRKGRS